MIFLYTYLYKVPQYTSKNQDVGCTPQKIYTVCIADKNSKKSNSIYCFCVKLKSYKMISMLATLILRFKLLSSKYQASITRIIKISI